MHISEARGNQPPSRGVDAISDALAMRTVPTLTTSGTGKSGMSFIEVRFDRKNGGFTGTVCDDAFLITLQLQTCHFDLYADGKLIRPQSFDAGMIAIFDLREKLSGDMQDELHAVDLYLPCRALDVIAEDACVPNVGDLAHPGSSGVMDPVASSLLSAVRPYLARRPDETLPLFVDHVAMALATHVAHRYGGMQHPRRLPRGGLAARQEQRAKELLNSNLHGHISLSDLADACGLSVRHFTRAFRQSTGMTAHEWLVHHRIERAKGLLCHSSWRLVDIALDCGFANPSHFAREFMRTVGVRPSAWRRRMRS